MPSRFALPRALQLFFLIALLMNALAVTVESRDRHRGLPWPYNSPVLDEKPAPDMQAFTPEFEHLHTPAFFDLTYPVPFMYPAPVAPLYGLIYAVPVHRVGIFLWTLAGTTLALALLFARGLRRRGVPWATALFVPLAAVGLSYPLAFELKQANMELFVVVLVAGAIALFLNGRWHAAAALIGIAGAMKLFPFVYLGLFLARRRYAPLLTAFAVAAVVTVASLRYLDPSIVVAWHGIQNGLNYYQMTVAAHMRREIGYDHSLFSILKLATRLRHKIDPNAFEPVVHLYLAAVALVGVVVFFVRIRLLPVVNMVLALCIASIWLSPVSYDYTLLHMYVPWALLVIYAFRQRDHVAPRGLIAAFAGLAFVTSIDTEVILRGYTVGGQLKALCLGALFLLALFFPFPEDVNVPVTSMAEVTL